MSGLIIFACLACLVPMGYAFNANGYDLKMDSYPEAPRVLYVPPKGNPMASFVDKEFTFCFHAVFDTYDKMNVATLISLASKDSYNEILIELRHSTRQVAMALRGSYYYIDAVPPRDKWTHFCISWQSMSGVAKVYIDGKMAAKKSDVAKGDTLYGNNGYFNLGQDQDGYDSGFQGYDGMRGKMTHFNAWDRVLSDDEVIQVANCALEGNLIAWSTANWLLSGHLDLLPSTAPCGARIGGVGGGAALAPSPAEEVAYETYTQFIPA